MDHVVGGSQNHSSQIVAVTSVSPAKLTEPRQVCQILINDETENQKINAIRKIEGCYQIVLYYENVQEEDHDWSLTGWIVESLARALLDHPLLTGRLQKKDITGFEIVSNDSGIRLLEANYPTTLSEFLELKEKECDDHDHEADLVFWNGIDAKFPQFSPLFYVQANIHIHFTFVFNFYFIYFFVNISLKTIITFFLIEKNDLYKNHFKMESCRGVASKTRDCGFAKVELSLELKV
jgi:hypothetical protein